MPISFLRRKPDWRARFCDLREPKTLDELALDERAISMALDACPIPVEDYFIDVEEYGEWFARADYAGHHAGYYVGNLAEKSLEHYLAARLLGLRSGIRFVDVASQNGTAAEVYERLYGIEAWRQDLDFRTDRNSRVIGGNAAQLDTEDNFFDAMALHCSFEHFEGTSDSGFVREAGRVLRPGGKCVIAPLYLCQQYSCLVDPMIKSVGDDLYEADMVLHMMPGFGNRHCRFYDVGHLVERVWNCRGGLGMKVLRMMNYRDVDPSCYLRFALVLEKK